ncbi:major facilitator family transporter [Rahnella aquatilis CIP 78.65 = ATCC 33071]|uniref:Arabinose efflux permease family protein n=1 Tax=Rahnella aquatilis (strain ATCC 33071 / DSM 4594 / JCM 1683 / NBRC 105701 / NCIMB 13365 / CIP 78.65) TaxID=745277 RepID=H2IZ46_RAHAC|nr:MFS transporter [Rahnella aquatilis]AEX50959.1 arabinose efflux permease family protein [Rahnella aquatilis CIP 78.65 = ATCC 33071]KFD18555.1 major facilitator family transporter [Rahnella aquatilis CIP 78.65 = ATCC 33071]
MNATALKSPLPLSALLAMALTGFIAIMTETLPAGLLPQIAASLDVSPAMAGQLVTLYAAGSLMAVIPLAALTRGWNRRTALLTAIFGFLIFNTLTTFSTNYFLTLFARWVAGAAAGLAWGLLAGYARRMVPVHQQGRALSVAMVGTPLALSVGVPLGTWMGSALGWRMAFGVMSAITVLLIVWVIRKVPDYPGQAAGERQPLRQVLMMPGVRSILMVILLWMLAHNLLYTYIVPFLRLSGLDARADQILLVFGIGALAGIGITGMLVDKHLRRTLLTSLFMFALLSLMLALSHFSPLNVTVCVALWGLTFGGAATLLQTAMADATGEHADMAQSMVVVAWNLAIAGGGLTGGVLLETAGIAIFPWAMQLLIVAGLIIAVCARKNGFRPGARHAAIASMPQEQKRDQSFETVEKV